MTDQFIHHKLLHIQILSHCSVAVKPGAVNTSLFAILRSVLMGRVSHVTVNPLHISHTPQAVEQDINRSNYR